MLQVGSQQHKHKEPQDVSQCENDGGIAEWRIRTSEGYLAKPKKQYLCEKQRAKRDDGRLQNADPPTPQVSVQWKDNRKYPWKNEGQYEFAR